MKDRQEQAGFTLIELMVGLVVASIAVGFIFRIYATSSVAYRTQSQVAETMQTLRTAKQTLTKKLRNAGYYASTINTAINTGSTGHAASGTAPSGVYMLKPVRIVNNSNGPDEVYMVYADTSCAATVESGSGPPFNSAESNVTSTSCFADGDVAVAVRTSDGTNGTKKGWGCVLEITHVQPGPKKLQHNPAADYNMPGNKQCEHLEPDWKDGNTVFMKFTQEGYRIKPNDARGVLQYSASGGLQNDWQDLAFGFVDMQFAIQVYEPNDTTDDADGLVGLDGLTSTKFDWYSGENMETIDLSGSNELLQIRVNLIARTIAEVEGVGTTVTPSMIGNAAKPNNNEMGDRGSVTISQITDKTSPYYGNYVYRMVSTVVDLRNLGVGRAL